MAEEVLEIKVEPLTREAFKPYGEVVTEDGGALLDLARGRPHVEILTTRYHPFEFTRMARHCRCTQTLIAMEGKPSLMAVAPADDPDDPAVSPDPSRIRAFLVEGNQGITLARGTFHNGPYPLEAVTRFVNVELEGTNTDDFDAKEVRGYKKVRIVF